MRSPYVSAQGIPLNTWRTVTDARNGYHSIPLHPDDKYLTTFITQWGRYRYLRAPQGYASSGDGFNRRMDKITADFERLKFESTIIAILTKTRTWNSTGGVQ